MSHSSKYTAIYMSTSKSMLYFQWIDVIFCNCSRLDVCFFFMYCTIEVLFLGHAFAQIMLREFTMFQESHSQIHGLSMCPSMFVFCVCVSNLTLLFRNIAV